MLESSPATSKSGVGEDDQLLSTFSSSSRSWGIKVQRRAREKEKLFGRILKTHSNMVDESSLKEFSSEQIFVGIGAMVVDVIDVVVVVVLRHILTAASLPADAMSVVLTFTLFLQSKSS